DFMDSLLGFMMSVTPRRLFGALKRLMWNPRKSKPSFRCMMRVFVFESSRPRFANQISSVFFALTASFLEWQKTTKSSAYRTNAGESGPIHAYRPVECLCH